jgi:hypothetical protein
MKEHLYSWFEREWQSTVSSSSVRIQRSHKIPIPTWGSVSTSLMWEDTIQVEHVPIMKIEIAEPDLVSMIRELKDHKAHAEVQKRYPHLREAYMNYLSQVYLTVDEMPD